MIPNDSDECPDIVRAELAVFSEDQLPLFVEDENIAAVVGNLPCIHQYFFVIPDIDGPRIALLFILEGRRNGEVGKPGRCHIDDPDRLIPVSGKLLFIQGFAGVIVRIFFVRVDVKKDMDLPP